MSARPRRLLTLAAALFATAALVGGCEATSGLGSARASSANAPSPSGSGSSGGVSVGIGPSSTPGAPPAAKRLAVRKPRIVWDPIPVGSKRKAEMVAYVRRHYGNFMKPTWRLVDPHVIVIHYTESPTFQSTYNTFAPDVPDPELHELPNTCAHFVIDQYGVIHQLVAVGTMCRHTVGLNWTAIGIEHVGYSDQQVLDNRRELTASLVLVRWLRCRFRIPVKDVIGHNESLSSPYHREDVPALRTQTHSDFDHADMQLYRRKLAALGGCPA